MRLPILVLVLALTGCTSALQNCETAAQADFNTVSALILETRQNIERGYAIERTSDTSIGVQFCIADQIGGNFGIQFCNETVVEETETLIPIDPAAEQRKLATLEARLDVLRPVMERELAACRAEFGTEA